VKAFTFVVASFFALAPMHAFAGQAQVPSAPFQVVANSGGGGGEPGEGSVTDLVADALSCALALVDCE
jgi:hypothetical protein